MLRIVSHCLRVGIRPLIVTSLSSASVFSWQSPNVSGVARALWPSNSWGDLSPFGPRLVQLCLVSYPSCFSFPRLRSHSPHLSLFSESAGCGNECQSQYGSPITLGVFPCARSKYSRRYSDDAGIDTPWKCAVSSPRSVASLESCFSQSFGCFVLISKCRDYSSVAMPHFAFPFCHNIAWAKIAPCLFQFSCVVHIAAY